MHTDTREQQQITAIRAIIVDDEPMAREYLKLILSRVCGVEVLAEAQTAVECLDKVRTHNPDVVFLDIHLPDESGLNAAKALSELRKPPLVIFVTGYEEYALPAFEVAAIDYVTKPFSQERLEKTLDRVRSRLMEVHDTDQVKSSVLGRIAIRERDGAKLIPVEEICYINTHGRKVMLHTLSKAYSTHYTISELEHKLRGFRFFRANEGCLVNLDKVKEVVYEGARTYELLLSCEQRELLIPLSRSRTQKLRELLDF